MTVPVPALLLHTSADSARSRSLLAALSVVELLASQRLSRLSASAPGSPSPLPPSDAPPGQSAALTQDQGQTEEKVNFHLTRLKNQVTFHLGVECEQ